MVGSVVGVRVGAGDGAGTGTSDGAIVEGAGLGTVVGWPLGRHVDGNGLGAWRNKGDEWPELKNAHTVKSITEQKIKRARRK